MKQQMFVNGELRWVEVVEEPWLMASGSPYPIPYHYYATSGTYVTVPPPQKDYVVCSYCGQLNNLVDLHCQYCGGRLRFEEKRRVIPTLRSILERTT